MGWVIIQDWDQGYQCFANTTTMRALGPVFDISDDLEQFLEDEGISDPRVYNDKQLISKFYDWKEKQE